MILLIAKNTVQEGKQQEFVELAKKMIENTRQEEGCIYYDLVADQNDEQVYFFMKNTKRTGGGISPQHRLFPDNCATAGCTESETF